MTVVRYRQMPAELDGVLIQPDTLTEALALLRQHGRDGYEGHDGLRVAPTSDYPAFDVPHGHVLIRDVRTGAFAPATCAELHDDRYVGVAVVPLRPPPQPAPRHSTSALDRPLGQPGHPL